ncbi:MULTISPECIES: CopY/TcrY family copper transport repressor [unclassified Streptococcus]|uniref:CopY/TcrY family copper transport repressor n=1 Tax=unclassified Streptococcus TaxID=2608887 RepID=UPI001072D224|nr:MULTISPECIES: CopY/TcrY family copper transport repressor [unclassified Streptococcus]MBF0786745.1 CopY/TcrY family copper transport repressor [Streptococcus sp. 19428wC2_LYSM12]MCQ9211599.1 CopY/TcrY family copper transport repressor [Streptococcus sp. B01]MCQ9213206.1 CopY/TcrY family copper transport repressor [Streptococcus sp. O1]TFV06493.1 CopY/TcrY family copper transport repressor [Streptococcus sp. LYSM12]
MEQMISAAEWQVMRVIWACPGRTSSQIITALQEGVDWQATTIKTLLGRLRKKAYLEMKKEGSQYRYYPLVEEREHVQIQLQNLLDTMCSTKNGELVGQLLEMGQFSRSDLQVLATQIANQLPNAPHSLQCSCLAGQCTCHIMRGKSSI